MKFSFDIHYSLFDILRFKKVLNPDLKLRYKVGIGRKPVGIYAEFFPIRLNETGCIRPGFVRNKRGRYKKTFRIRVFQHQIIVQTIGAQKIHIIMIF